MADVGFRNMKKSGIVALVFGIVLTTAGCMSIPQHYRGEFVGKSGDFVIVEKNGGLWRAPSQDQRDQARSYGIIVETDYPDQKLGVVQASVHAHLMTKIRYSEDYHSLFVVWTNTSWKGVETEYKRVKRSQQ